MLDPSDYPPGPNGMAQLCEDRIAELEAKRAAAKTRGERKPINQQLHTVRQILRFAVSRAGYVRPADDTAAEQP